MHLSPVTCKLEAEEEVCSENRLIVSCSLMCLPKTCNCVTYMAVPFGGSPSGLTQLECGEFLHDFRIRMLQGIFLDDFGNVAEGPTMNVAILTKDGEFVASPSHCSLLCMA